MAFQVTLQLSIKSHHRKCFDNIIILHYTFILEGGMAMAYSDITFILKFSFISNHIIIVVMHRNKIYVHVVAGLLPE